MLWVNTPICKSDCWLGFYDLVICLFLLNLCCCLMSTSEHAQQGTGEA